MRRLAIFAFGLLLIGAGCAPKPVVTVTDFAGCVAAGNPVQESQPRTCRADGKTFTEPSGAPGDVTPPDAPPGIELTPPAEYGKTVVIEDGSSVVYADGLQVTVLEIADSRCPKDVQCVWAGELSPKLSVTRLDSPAAPVEVQLGTLTKKEAKALGMTFALEGATEDVVTLKVTK